MFYAQILGTILFGLLQVMFACGEQCYADLRHETRGSITSPNYPHPYGSMSFCYWKLQTNEGNRLHLRFQRVRIYHTEPLKDFVVVFNDSTCMSPVMAIIAEQPQFEYVSTGNKMSVLFLSDSVNEAEGFTGRFEKNAIVTQPIGQTLIDQQDFCRHELFEHSGKIDTIVLPKYVLCLRRITVKPQYRIRLEFIRHLWRNPLTWVRTLDGDDCSSPILASMHNTSTQTPNVIVSSGNQVMLVSQGHRFRVKYTTVYFHCVSNTHEIDSTFLLTTAHLDEADAIFLTDHMITKFNRPTHEAGAH
ncbi:hypothetical protein PHET_10881 [Paragonimus heterotremus]|uniref:CUB domain-containing protein n=1 Tax=Paragonimus heterotremus TaxID=100268 RepID=A0A8J4T9Q3_9TREM|nr:hypothetical protein PHET_10881 [Paragonimus heterotremus]